MESRKNVTRAQRKKLVRSFKVGDLVTWGTGEFNHVVLEVTSQGVIVDSTSSEYGTIQSDGTRRMLVLFDANMRRRDAYFKCVGRGPVRKVSS